MGNGTITSRATHQPITTENVRNSPKHIDDAKGSWLGRMVSKVWSATKIIANTIIPDLIYITAATIFFCASNIVTAGIFISVSALYVGMNIIRLVETIQDIRRLHSIRNAN